MTDRSIGCLSTHSHANPCECTNSHGHACTCTKSWHQYWLQLKRDDQKQIKRGWPWILGQFPYPTVPRLCSFSRHWRTFKKSRTDVSWLPLPTFYIIMATPIHFQEVMESCTIKNCTQCKRHCIEILAQALIFTLKINARKYNTKGFIYSNIFSQDLFEKSGKQNEHDSFVYFLKN